MMPSSASCRRRMSCQKSESSASIAIASSRARESAWSRRTMKNSSRLLAAMPKNLARSSRGWPALACSKTRLLKESQLSSRSKYSDGSRRSGSAAAVSAVFAGARRVRRATVGLMALPVCHFNANGNLLRFPPPDEGAGEFTVRFEDDSFIYAPCIDVHIREPGGSQLLFVVGLVQRASQATDPQFHIPTDSGGYLAPHDDVGYREPAARLEDAEGFGQHLTFIRREVDDAVRNVDIDGARGERDRLNIAFQEFHVAGAGLALVVAGEVEHLVGHIEPVHLTRRPNTTRGEQYVDAA